MRIDVAAACPTCAATIADGAPYCPACGAGQPGRPPAAPDPVELADPRATAPLLPTHPSATSLVLGVGAVALLLVLSVPVLVIRALFFGPDDVVRGYFDALANRSADAAWAQLEPGGASRAGDPLLSSAALTGPGYLPPSHLTITSLRVDGVDAVASVRYTVAGRQIEDQVKVHRGRATNLFQRWHVTGGLRPLAVSVPAVARFQLGGVVLAPAGAGVQLDAFPGGYVLALPRDPLLAAQPVTVLAGDPEGGALRLGIQDSAAAEIDKQVRAYLDQCTKSTSLMPPGCPFSITGYGYLEPVHWALVDYPKVQAQVGTDGRVTVTTVSPGTIRATGAPGSYAEPGTATFSVTGTASSAGGAVQYTPQQQ
jgi:hypothetical protein